MRNKHIKNELGMAEMMPARRRIKLSGESITQLKDEEQMKVIRDP